MDKEQKLKEYAAKVKAFVTEDQDFKDMVNKIEGGIKTTKGNYGKYMQLLQQIGKGDKIFTFALAEGLKAIGADFYGVNWALKILFN